MKPVHVESRVTYGIEFYPTVEAADARGALVESAPSRSVTRLGRAPRFDRHDYDTHVPLFAVVVP